MKPSEKRPENLLRDRWMISYMDVLTILLIFFVAVAAKSVTRPTPVAAPLVPRIEDRAGLEKIEQELTRRGLNRDGQVDFRMEARGLVISLPQTVLFQQGLDEVNAAALPLVGKIAAVLARIPNKISLIGHADPVPIHNLRFRSNWELAAGRGLRLLDLLTTRFAIPEARLSMASYGSVAPKGPNNTAEGRAGNRRVEILILDAGP
jgi:chemotaxis protein MotB